MSDDNKTTKNNENDEAEKLLLKQIKPDPLSQFHLTEDELRLELVKAQYALRETRRAGQPTGLLVIVDGMELSGKGAAVTQLRQWVDPRLLKVEATLGHTPSMLEPVWQSHVDHLPRHGNVSIYFGNWYADVIYGVLDIIEKNQKNANKHNSKAHKKKQVKVDAEEEQTLQDLDTEMWTDYLNKKLAILSSFEADLTANHTEVLKCWFHIDDETLKRRLKDDKKDPEWLYHLDWQDKLSVKTFNKVAKHILGQQDDWVIIDGSNVDNEDGQYSEKASLIFCHEVLHAMQQALKGSQEVDSTYPQENHPDSAFSWVDIPDVLTDIDDPDMTKSDYKHELKTKQDKLAKLLRDRGTKTGDKAQGHHVVFVFEGMDAAGKGGAIKRLVAPLDPREYEIFNIGAPMQFELQHPYLWRFWTHLPSYEKRPEETKLSRVAIFDRSWYGRVLVERIEGFASDKAWQRAYDEINRMEYDMAQKGTVILKYWLAIDKDEQLKRFEDREKTPHKRFKLTDEDWRNRDKWEDYVQSAADMLARTNTKYAPWSVVATNDKRTARLAVLDHAIKQLEAKLKK